MADSAARPFLAQIEPWYGAAEIDAVRAYLESGGWLIEFAQTRAFEAAIAHATGAAHCVAISSGTAALFAMLRACGIGAGDEVIVPDLTMIASATAVVLAGGVPVLVDVDPATLCLDLERAAMAITPRTRAIMVVSLNGRGPDMTAAYDLCARRGLLLLEDAAQSLGSRWRGQPLGTFGAAAALSFSAAKIVTTGQGGAVLTDDPAVAARVTALKDFGRRRAGVDVHDSIGFNFKFTDLQAAFGVAQLAGLDDRIARKKAIFAAYRATLAGVPQVRFVDTDLAETTPWFVDIFVDDAAALRQALERQGIGTRPVYPPVHSQPAISQAGQFPAADRIAAEGIWLPSSLGLDPGDISRVCDAIISFYR